MITFTPGWALFHHKHPDLSSRWLRFSDKRRGPYEREAETLNAAHEPRSMPVPSSCRGEQ